MISILGSCRQTSIDATLLHELLTYPHYSNEILQEILFVKSGCSNISAQDCRYIFRTCLLGKTLDHNHIKEVYDKTDVFLVEIASRKMYQYGGYYLHHIAEEQQYGFQKRGEIKVQDETDQEIENNLIRIREELYPKKMIVVTHIYTKKEGKRYELVKLLENLCWKLGIRVINPSQRLSIYEEKDLYQSEQVLAHYTSVGHEAIKKVYEKEIEKTRIEKTVCQIYHTSQSRMQKYTFHGLGDYLRGTIYLHQQSKINNFNLQVCFSHHSLSHFLYSPSFRSIQECEDAKYFFEGVIDFTHVENIFTNIFHTFPVDDDTIQFVREKCLCPRINFQKKLDNLELPLIYNVIHVRSGDACFTQMNNSHLEKCINIIESLDRENTIIVSDSVLLQNTLAEKFNLAQLGGKKIHLGKTYDSTDAHESTLIEFFVLLNASKIYQISAYSWGSGFSTYASILGKVSLVSFKI